MLKPGHLEASCGPLILRAIQSPDGEWLSEIGYSAYELGPILQEVAPTEERARWLASDLARKVIDMMHRDLLAY
jgi:hypothetical protein